MATLNKLFTNLLILGMSINIALYLFGAFSIDPQVQIPGSLSTMTSWFNLSPFNLLFTGATAAVVGVAALLLRQGTYAIYALLISAIGVFFNVVKGFVFAVPNVISALFPGSPTGPITYVVGVIVMFAGFIYLFELAIQRRARDK